jgi:DNA-binding transcriptional LysR family regulator
VIAIGSTNGDGGFTAGGPDFFSAVTSCLRPSPAGVVPTFAVAILLVAASDYVGLIPRRLAEHHGPALGLRWFPIPAQFPEVDVHLSWYARRDADPAQKWLRESIRTAIP